MTGEILNSKLAQESITPLLLGPTITWQHFQDRHNILLDSQFTENRLFLREIPHTHSSPSMHCEARHIALSKVNSTPIWPHKPYDKIKSSRFASTIWPKQPNDFAPINMDIDPVHYCPPAVDLY